MPRRTLALVCLLFTCAGMVFLRTIVLVDRSPELTFFYNLPPLFDGAQYFAEAASLVNESTWKIWVNGVLHPSLPPVPIICETTSLMRLV